MNMVRALSLGQTFLHSEVFARVMVRQWEYTEAFPCLHPRFWQCKVSSDYSDRVRALHIGCVACSSALENMSVAIFAEVHSELVVVIRCHANHESW